MKIFAVHRGFLNAFAVLTLSSAAAIAAPDTTVRFNRDVRPILSDNCFACHGPDASSRKAGLRLDTKEGLFEKTPKREPAIVPGKLNESEFWARIITTNVDDKMPPEDSHKQLTPQQIETLRKWILAGAPWEGHWAFIKPERPALPNKLKGESSKFKVRNAIDALVLAKLQEKGLVPNPEADKRSLIRRVYLDLVGLPPEPSDVQAFLGDKSPDAYEKVVKRLLASKRFGEHRARYWLDAARYADTHGLHFDNYREMWPYRDWVIKAFNQNMPFDQFTLLQLAGDLLSPEEMDALIATGFQRCNMTTNEGGTIDEENLANYANDRVSTFGWVYMGVTMNCAACHDHKFDPITQKDFYSLEAFFRNTTQPAKDGNVKDSTPSILVPQSDEDAKRWKALPGEIASAKSAVEQRRKEARLDFDQWVANARPEEFAKDVPTNSLLVHFPMNDGTNNVIRGTVAGKETQLTASGLIDWRDGGRYGLAPKLKKGTNFVVGDVASFERTNSFSYGLWVRMSAPGNFGPLLARMDETNAFRGWDLSQIGKKLSVHLVNKWPDDSVRVETRDEVIKPGVFQHVFVTYDGSSKAKGIKIYVDGAEVPLKTDKDQLKSSLLTHTPLRIGKRSGSQELEDGRIQDVRVYDRKLSGKEVAAIARIAPLEYVLKLPAAQRSKEQTDGLFETWLTTRDTDYVARTKHLAALNKEETDIKARNPVTHIQREKTNSMPEAFVLFRGQYDKKKDKVFAEVPAVLPRLPKDAPTNRLGLAKWTVARENPLTARVTVNRFWQEIFGVGLVKTAEDFGTQGEPPQNQELLDWLAVEFVESGWDVKRIFELIVTSSTYRQSAEVTPEKLEKDPANRFLSRGPRFRMDAEMLRDSALLASGLLVDKIGGAPVKPYQPDGIWEAVAMPESNTKKYTRDKGEALYRRSLYTFWKRAAPPAMMDIFNAPSREVCSVRRERTNTPLQALATLNDVQFIEAARNLAQVALLNAKEEEDALQAIAERVLSRPLTSKELKVARGTLKEARTFYDANAEEAKKLLAVGESKPSDKVPAPQLAAMTLVANQLMNLDEFLNK
jgi:mono/diheme cytochrome c family protein